MCGELDEFTEIKSGECSDMSKVRSDPEGPCKLCGEGGHPHHGTAKPLKCVALGG